MDRTTGIDIVLPWVDGEDPEWLKCFNKHLNVSEESLVGKLRYRDWGCLKYWFRSVEIYAPWIRTIHFITFGHVPDWLDLSCPKLNVVRHIDFIDSKYLPTFSSRTIELNVHRIKGLSSRFILFNDDTYLMSDVTEDYFFKGDLPCDSFIQNALSGGAMSHVAMNNVSELNHNFSKKDVVLKSWNKIFNYNYGAKMLRNICLMPWPNFTGFYDAHQPQSYLTSSFKDVWSTCGNALDKTCSNKFKSNDDCNHYLIRYWQLVTNCFSPAKLSGAFFELFTAQIESILIELKTSSYKTVCLNDVLGEDMYFESKKSKLIDFFDKRFPHKSVYEK